jgi:hypothetical protein
VTAASNVHTIVSCSSSRPQGLNEQASIAVIEAADTRGGRPDGTTSAVGVLGDLTLFVVPLATLI